MNSGGGIVVFRLVDEVLTGGIYVKFLERHFGAGGCLDGTTFCHVAGKSTDMLQNNIIS